MAKPNYQYEKRQKDLAKKKKKEEKRLRKLEKTSVPPDGAAGQPVGPASEPAPEPAPGQDKTP